VSKLEGTLEVMSPVLAFRLIRQGFEGGIFWPTSI
jgi:hypothetical protein